MTREKTEEVSHAYGGLHECKGTESRECSKYAAARPPSHGGCQILRTTDEIDDISKSTNR